MEGARFIETIRTENVLSYGPGNEPLPLEPLNVLIGPNGSGKSNLIEILSLLAQAPDNLQEPIRKGGSVGDWLWKGVDPADTATIDVTIRYRNTPLRYILSFTGDQAHFQIVNESVQLAGPATPTEPQPYRFYHYEDQENPPIIDMMTPSHRTRFKRQLGWDDIDPAQSVLSQRRDNLIYPELTYISNLFESTTFYPQWELGRHAPARLSQRTETYEDFLLPDCSNLANVLNNLLDQPHTKQQILEQMRDTHPSFTHFTTRTDDDTLQVFFEERGLHNPTPVTRLSEGSLKYLCLLTILCHPSPPGVICIENPETGLHPDLIPQTAKLLVEASARSQIFVTTHSDTLVDALTDTPEAVIICEKPENATQLRRLDSKELGPWLKKYRLGELWTRGQIGGNRW